jgi:hypothetical protein
MYYDGIWELNENHDMVISVFAQKSLDGALMISKKLGTIVYLPLPGEERESMREGIVESGSIVFIRGRYEYIEGRKREKARQRGQAEAVFAENNEYYVLKNAVNKDAYLKQ